MPIVTLDNIYFRREQIQELVAVLIDDQYKTVKWLDNGGKSIRFMVTHNESETIGERLLNQFNDIGAHNVHQHPIPNEQFDQIRFINKYDLGPLNRFQGFNGLIDNDIQLSLIIDNHYHLEGQLEISLALTIDHGDIVVFDKWSTWKSKKCFNRITVRVDPQFNNFFHRDQLLIDLSIEAFSDFTKSMNELKEFLEAAKDFTLSSERLKAVYLDLKDRNRSLTSLRLSDDNRDKIKKDLKRVSDFVERRNEVYFNYIDFIRIIAQSPPHFNYNPQYEFEITTNRAYNSLLKKQKIFSSRNNLRFPYEEEQLETLREIEPTI
jgi:hypothetical protein